MGTFSKPVRGKANNEKEIFLVLCLAQTPTIGGWGVPDRSREGDRPPLQSPPPPHPLGLQPGRRVRGRIPDWRLAGLIGRAAKETAVCQCYFKQASLAGAVILSLSEEEKIKFEKTKELEGRAWLRSKNP